MYVYTRLRHYVNYLITILNHIYKPLVLFWLERVRCLNLLPSGLYSPVVTRWREFGFFRKKNKILLILINHLLTHLICGLRRRAIIPNAYSYKHMCTYSEGQTELNLISTFTNFYYRNKNAFSQELLKWSSTELLQHFVLCILRIYANSHSSWTWNGLKPAGAEYWHCGAKVPDLSVTGLWFIFRKQKYSLGMSYKTLTKPNHEYCAHLFFE